MIPNPTYDYIKKSYESYSNDYSMEKLCVFLTFLKLSFRGAVKKCIIVCGVEKLERKGRDREAERE